jgi:hypothetical protein
MGRKRIKAEPLTNAQKQARFKIRQKEKMECLEAEVELLKTKLEAMNLDALRLQIKQELKAELKAKPRKLEKDADRESYFRGKIVGVCESAAFYIGKDRPDLAQFLLAHFLIDREKAQAALEADKRTKSLALESLDKYRAWNPPPKVLR